MLTDSMHAITFNHKNSRNEWNRTRLKHVTNGPNALPFVSTHQRIPRRHHDDEVVQIHLSSFKKPHHPDNEQKRFGRKGQNQNGLNKLKSLSTSSHISSYLMISSSQTIWFIFLTHMMSIFF